MSNDTNLEDYFTNPNFDVEAVKKVVLGLGLPLLILWLVITPLLLLLVTRGCGRAGRHDRHFIKKSPITLFFMALWLLVEFFQVNWFTFITPVDWPANDFLVFLNFFQLHFTKLNFIAWFWIFAGYAFFIIILLCIFLCCGEGSDTAFIIIGGLFLTMVPIFQPMMIKMFQALSCTYPIGSPPFLDVIPEMTCWEGGHLAYVVIAVLLIFIFYPSISITMSSMIGGSKDSTVWMAFLVIQFKMLQVFIFAFFNSFILPFLLSLLFVNTGYFLISLSMPNTNRALNITRIIFMAMSVWATIATLIAYATKDKNEWIGVGVLIGGWVAIPIIIVLIYFCIKWRRHRGSKGTSSQPSLDQSQSQNVKLDVPIPQEQPRQEPQPITEIRLTQIQGPPGSYYPNQPQPNGGYSQNQQSISIQHNGQQMGFPQDQNDGQFNNGYGNPNMNPNGQPINAYANQNMGGPGPMHPNQNVDPNNVVIGIPTDHSIQPAYLVS